MASGGDDFDTMKHTWENPFLETLNKLRNILDELKEENSTKTIEEKNKLIKEAIGLLFTFRKTNNILLNDNFISSADYDKNMVASHRDLKFLEELFDKINKLKGGKKRKSKKRKSKKRRSKSRRR
jgi:hypothetical protein